MAKQQLPTNFKDDVLTSQMAGRRKYNLIQNEDGTYSLDDVTEYSQVGSNFGAAQMNATNMAVNESFDKNKVIDYLDDIAANEQAGYAAGALAVRELNGNIIVDMKEDEFLTNETYLGQPVYGKYIDIKKIATQSHIPLNIPDSFFWIDTGNSYVYPISQNLDTMYPFPYVNPQDAASSIRYALSKKNKSIMLFGGDWTGYGLYLLVKYYKY